MTDDSAILASLSGPQIQAMSLRFYDRLPYKMIAVRMGVSLSSAKMLVARGLAVLHRDNPSVDCGMLTRVAV